MSVTELLPPSPLANERLHRLEWLRFLIACSMIVTIVAEVALLAAFGWTSVWVWPAIIVLQGYSLHVMTKMIGRERALAIKDWAAEIERLMGRARGESD